MKGIICEYILTTHNSIGSCTIYKIINKHAKNEINKYHSSNKNRTELKLKLK